MEEILTPYQNPTDLDVQRPFQGLCSYEEKNKLQFGGRDAGIKELYSLTEANRLTIVFGKSGIGKTSLLKAGLIPELLKNYFLPIYLRIDYSSAKTPLQQAKESIYKKLKQRDTAITEIGELTLWEYFSNLKLLNGLLTPVLIFDQFEEIFTIGKEKSQVAQEFIIELSDLAENRVPLAAQERLKTEKEIKLSLYEDQNFHMIISLREDYLANLESFKMYLPSIKNSRYRVLQMTAMQAMDAVMKPAKHFIDNEVAASIVKKLPGITELDFETSSSDQDGRRYVVEPFLLSLICYEINEKRIESQMEKISLELVAQFDITDVINSYYSKTIQGFGENVQQCIEDSLLTEGGFRKLQELEELEKKYNINTGDIQQLIEKRIVRKEMRDEVDYLELIHDVLTPAIKTRRDKRISERFEKERREAIEKTIELDRGKRKKRMRYAILIIFTFLTALLFFTVKEKRKAGNLAFANNLILKSRILSKVYVSDTTAALISRAAYLINKANDGGNNVIFYNSMYKYLNNLNQEKPYFEISSIDSTEITDMVNDGNDIFYFAGINGKIYRKNGMDSTPELLNHFNDEVTSITISPNKRYMAVAGMFNDVKIIDLLKGQNNFENLTTGDTAGTDKSVCFTGDGRLILRLHSGIIGWERKLNSWKQISWNNKIQVAVDDGKQKLMKNQQVLSNNNYFEYGGKSFNCMKVFGNKIALGTDLGVILITGDSLLIIESKDSVIATAIAFHPSGEYLFTGDNIGAIYRISLTDFRIEYNHYQTTWITDIAFSSDRHYMASSSFDCSIAIWDLKKNWNSSLPLVLWRPGESSDVDNTEEARYLESGINGNYFLSGYSDGKILKWPMNMDILADLICSNVNTALDTMVLKKVLKVDFNFKKIEKYNCKTENKN